MTRNLKFQCSISGCGNPPHQGGLCEEHRERELINGRALDALHSCSVDGAIPDDPTLRDDLEEASRRWGIICAVQIGQHSATGLPLEYAKFAEEWCISWAREIIKAQEALSAGQPMPASYGRTKQWVLEKFKQVSAPKK